MGCVSGGVNVYANTSGKQILGWHLDARGEVIPTGCVNAGNYETRPGTTGILDRHGRLVIVGAFVREQPTSHIVRSCDYDEDVFMEGGPKSNLVFIGSMEPRLFAAVAESSNAYSILGGCVWGADEGFPCEDPVGKHERVGMQDYLVSVIASMPSGRCQHTAVRGLWDDAIYVGGGDVDSNTAAASNLIKCSDGEWSVVPNSNTMAYTDAAMVAYGRWIVIVGGVVRWDEGEDDEGETIKSDQVVLYDTMTGVFQQLAALETARAGHKIAALNGNLFVLGDGDPEVVPLPPVGVWTVATNLWYPTDYRRVVSTLVHSFARTEALSEDCVLHIVSFLAATDFLFV